MTAASLDRALPDRHRALFLSDLHLGALGCRADLILDFLERHDAATIYLVGDILDVWHPLALHWTPTHDRILDLLRRRAAEGSRLVYLVGNHDAAMRDPREAARLPAEVRDEAVHVTAEGQRLLVLHGDVCDARWLRGHVLTRLGSRVDAALRVADRELRVRLSRDRGGAVGSVARRLDAAIWGSAPGRLSGLAAWAWSPDADREPEAGADASLVGLALAWMGSVLYRNKGHERRLAALAVARGCDGVVCGHFHIAGLHRDYGVLYANCGDWIDGFTALAEGGDGRLRMLEAPARARPARHPPGWVDPAAPLSQAA